MQMAPYAACGNKNTTDIMDNTTNVVAESRDVVFVYPTVLSDVESYVHDVLDV